MRLTKADIQEMALYAEQPAETPETFVEGLIELYWEILGRKNLYGGLMQVGGITFVLCPYTTRGQVERAGARPIPVVTPEGWKRVLSEHDEPVIPKVFREIAEDAEEFKRRRRRK